MSNYSALAEQYLSALPHPFQTFVRTQAWDRGHSASEEEVDMITYELAFALLTAWEEYLCDPKGVS